MRKASRRIVAVLLFLIGGAIVNVAVAWGVAWWVFDMENVGDEGAVVTAFDSEGWVIESWWTERWEGLGSTGYTTTWLRFKTNRAQFKGYAHPSEVLPAWLGFDKPRQAFVDEKIDRDDRSAILRGWPTRALGCIIWADPPIEPAAIQAGSYSGAGSLVPRLLPLRPIWPGFIINTVFYAGILWLLFIAPFTVRRLLRRKRRLCERCAYPIGTWGGSPVCTECGAAVVEAVDTPRNPCE